MFKKRNENYTCINVQKLNCWIPPEGWVYDRTTGKMEEVGVYERSRLKSEQYWEVTPLPDKWEELRDEEELRRQTSPDFFDEELQTFRNQEWKRRLNGYWFRNNGKAVYITGLHYFTLNYWEYDIGLPDFRWPDAKKFYFLQYCIEDPDCMGMLEFARRRSGKSYMAGAALYETASRTQKAICGIQSKSRDDAADFFMLHVIEPFKKLPDFFVPEYDLAQGDSPKRELRFFSTVQKGKLALNTKKPALKSRINFRAPAGKLYDGKKMKFYVRDEFGKMEEDSLTESHKVVKYCFMDGTKIIGTALYTTTVEDMSNGNTIKESKQMYDDSDPDERDANNRTKTMLYRYVTFAHESLFFDKYGYPMEEEANRYLDNLYQELIDAGDFRGLASEQRKNPRTIDEIFKVAAKAPIFNIIKLQDRLSVVKWRKESEYFRRGNFAWKGGKRDSEVVFSEMPNGRVLLSRDCQTFPQNLHRPKNKHIFVLGCDPYDHKAAQTPSNGAAYCMKKFMPSDLKNSVKPVMEYIARPQPNVFYEDMVKACVYFGAEILVENNKVGLINYFDDRGFDDFLMWWPEQLNPGIFAGERSKQLAAEAIDSYIEEYSDRIDFIKLLEDMLVFDLSNSTKNDATMAFGWTLLGAGPTLDGQVKEKVHEVSLFFKTYKTN